MGGKVVILLCSIGGVEMKNISFDYTDTSLVTGDEVRAAGQKLQNEIARLAQARNSGYETDYASINVVFDRELLSQVKQVVEEKKSLNPTTLVVIGIGGSNLGTIAVHEAIYGTFYNEQKPEINVYFADTVDSDYIYDIILLLEQQVEKGHNIIINVVSKSGSTTETIANFEVVLHLLQNYKKDDYQKYVVVTTDEGSKLWKLAKEKGFSLVEVPANIGGRYSVFSAVGLFPLAMLGVDIDALLAGAQSMVNECLNIDIFNNMAALSAAILFAHYKKGVTIHDTFTFSVDLKGVSTWYRQLMGESIGKAENRAGKTVNVGITPTVSVGSVDLHSVAQLYLGGPYDKFTTFIYSEKNKSNLSIPVLNEFESLVEKIQGKSLSTIMDAIMQGTQTAYKNNKRPFVSLSIPEKSAYYLGQLMQMKMIEMMYLGYLLDVNPFNQPQVELYKKETRKILSRV